MLIVLFSSEAKKKNIKFFIEEKRDFNTEKECHKHSRNINLNKEMQF